MASPAAGRFAVDPSGAMLIGALALAWGLTWPVAKLPLAEMSPWVFRAIALVIGGGGLLALAWRQPGGVKVPRREIAPLILVSACNITAYHLLSAYGISLLPAGRAVILAFTFPAWTVALGAVFLGEAVTPNRAAALICGLAAIGLLLLPSAGAIGGSTAGIAYTLGAAFAWAVGTIIFKRCRWTVTTTALAGWQVVIGSVPVILGAVLVVPAPDVAAWSLAAWAGLAYMAIVSTLIGHWVWFKMLGIMPVSVASISSLAIPVVGVLSGAAFLGEPLGLAELGALALVTVSLALVLVVPARRRAG